MSGLTEIESGSRAAFRRRVGRADESDADTDAIYDAKVMDEDAELVRRLRAQPRNDDAELSADSGRRRTRARRA
jgi:hypothetical protein